MGLAFLKVFSSQSHEACSFYCLSGYDDAWIAALSILQAGANDGTAVDAVLPGVAAGFNGVSGNNALQASGDRVPGSYQIWKVTTDSSGKGSWIEVGTWDYNADKVTWVAGQP